MKTIRFSFLLTALLAVTTITLFPQTGSLEKIVPEAYGTQYPLTVGVSKTTVLVFPNKIAPGGVDLGSADIIASTINGVDNILRVKAATVNFAPTNVTVVTTDGKVYSFYVAFSDYPDDRPIDLGKQLPGETANATFQERQLNDMQVDTLARAIVAKKPFLHGPGAKSYGVHLALKGIYTEKDMLFFQLQLKNKSPMEYAVDFSRFYIRDRKRAKRTAWQELELKPLTVQYVRGNQTEAKSGQYIVLAFRKFTIADHKQFAVQLFEKDGDRHLELKINGRLLLRARNPDR